MWSLSLSRGRFFLCVGITVRGDKACGAVPWWFSLLALLFQADIDLLAFFCAPTLSPPTSKHPYISSPFRSRRCFFLPLFAHETWYSFNMVSLALWLPCLYP
jgi:hypothetical protein